MSLSRDLVKKNYQQFILDHYKKVAKLNQLSPTSSMADQKIRQAECHFFLKEIEILYKKKKKLKIFEMGPGNGYLLALIKEKFPQVLLYALEFSPDLFQLAQKREISDLQLLQGDIGVEEHIPKEWGQFDVIISERVIINILDRKDQYLACHLVLKRLKKRGSFLLSESFKEPLQNLNEARRDFGLTPILESEHNDYLSEKFWEKLCQKEGLIEVPPHTPSNFLSTHFFLTRIVHEGLRSLARNSNDLRPKFSYLLAFFEAAIPPGILNFSPILFRVCVKK